MRYIFLLCFTLNSFLFGQGAELPLPLLYTSFAKKAQDAGDFDSARAYATVGCSESAVYAHGLACGFAGVAAGLQNDFSASTKFFELGCRAGNQPSCSQLASYRANALVTLNEDDFTTRDYELNLPNIVQCKALELGSWSCEPEQKDLKGHVRISIRESQEAGTEPLARLEPALRQVAGSARLLYLRNTEHNGLAFLESEQLDGEQVGWNTWTIVTQSEPAGWRLNYPISSPPPRRRLTIKVSISREGRLAEVLEKTIEAMVKSIRWYSEFAEDREFLYRNAHRLPVVAGQITGIPVSKFEAGSIYSTNPEVTYVRRINPRGEVTIVVTVPPGPPGRLGWLLVHDTQGRLRLREAVVRYNLNASN